MTIKDFLFLCDFFKRGFQAGPLATAFTCDVMSGRLRKLPFFHLYGRAADTWKNRKQSSCSTAILPSVKVFAWNELYSQLGTILSKLGPEREVNALRWSKIFETDRHQLVDAELKIKSSFLWELLSHNSPFRSYGDENVDSRSDEVLTDGRHAAKA